MAIGPLMLDLTGVSLTEQERDLLVDPQVGGIILFSRNYSSKNQLDELIGDIRSLRQELIIAVDHEGGRVQRFREGFTKIPAMHHLGRLYLKDRQQAIQSAQQVAWLLAAELLVHDIDLSFAPVLDVDHCLSQVIGDRAFSDDTEIIVELGQAFIDGFHEAGMAATGKHFPGHGGVTADSHLEIPVDERTLADMESADLQPFRRLAHSLDAIMPAHVIYPAVDNKPAGFSRIWLQQILRQQLKFEGVIFSDDLSMQGASVAGGFSQRTEAALAAGCDMVLVCNDRKGALEVLDYLNRNAVTSSNRLSRLKHRGQFGNKLSMDVRWREAVRAVQFLT